MSATLVGWALKQTTGSAARKAVLLALADHANGHTGRCCPHMETVAEELELSFRTVQRAVVDLCEKGFLARSRDKRADGSWAGYHYTFPMSSVSSPPDTQSCGPPDTQSGQGEPEVSPLNQKESLPTNVGDVQAVYDHWRKTRGKDRANYDTISPVRRQKIKTRLREFSADDLRQAIDNVARDPWPDRALHDDITIIFRSREQVEKFIEMGRLPLSGTAAVMSPKRHAEQWVRTAGWQYPDADLWEELGRYDLTTEEKRDMTRLAMELQRSEA